MYLKKGHPKKPSSKRAAVKKDSRQKGALISTPKNENTFSFIYHIVDIYIKTAGKKSV